jgi:peptidoglycan/LPS O-acetylase OafA/YrhL
MGGKEYFKDLDALRFLAFFVVFISHCFGFLGYVNDSKTFVLLKGHLFQHGDLGVNFFFVLSGFLITYLLLNEKDSFATIGLKNFYTRRILRIFPVYFLTIFVGFFVIPNLALDEFNLPFKYKVSIDELLYYSIFLANFEIVKNGLSSIITSVLWSVSIEEQFYLLWPFCILVFNKKRLIWLAIILLIISFIARSLYPNSILFQKYASLSVMSDLIVGCMAAILVNTNKSFVKTLQNLSSRKILIIYILGLILIPSRGFSHYFGQTIYEIYNPFERVLFSLLFIFVILEQTYAQHSLFKLRKFKLISTLGKYSYGFYCYHMIAVLMVIVSSKSFHVFDNNQNLYHFLAKMLLSLLFTLILGLLSYNLYEKHFIALKSKYQPKATK